ESDAALPAGGVFGADRQSVWLLPGAFSTDVAAFDAGVRAPRAPSGDTEQIASIIEAALTLYAGPLLPGICEEDAALFREQQRLAGAYEDALRRVVALHESAGRFPNAVAHARRLLGLNPADEETCARLLRLFARTGEREAALRTVSSFTRRHRDAHGGNSPSNMLQQLAHAVPAREPAVPPAVAVAPTSAGGARLPLPLTRYFGRENERTFLLDRLQGRHSRLVSLLGPGGCGKTRFALELGRRFESDESGSGIRVERRAFFIPLEPVARARQIIPAVYRVIQQQDEAREDGTALRTMLARLLQECAEHPLLILDNCEHLAGDPEMLAVIADLLARVPSLSLLATSRRPLCLEGEQTFPLSPLATPPSSAESGSSTRSTPDELLEHYASVQMFVDRVCNVRLDFRLTRQNQSAVALLCARLEGLPLAIELCAAWAATLTPEQMLAELQDRFDLLASRRPDVPPRHHSMRAAIDTSYTLLPDDLRGSFAALSVFRGGWFTEAAQQIIGGDAVPSLRDQLARLQEH
ncbi:MAG: AAA family ATPase, partial [Akkermansiaceae bacterium]|nr:AAA family ATPase [Armatimonadota bacterium]